MACQSFALRLPCQLELELELATVVTPRNLRRLRHAFPLAGWSLAMECGSPANRHPHAVFQVMGGRFLQNPAALKWTAFVRSLMMNLMPKSSSAACCAEPLPWLRRVPMPPAT